LFTISLDPPASDPRYLASDHGTGSGTLVAQALTRPSPVSLRKNGAVPNGPPSVEPDGFGPSQPANERSPGPRAASGVVPRIVKAIRPRVESVIDT